MATLSNSKREDVKMSKTKRDIFQQLDWNSPNEMENFDNDIIDVSSMNFNDFDTCFQKPNRSNSDERIHDLYSWLRSEPGKEGADSHESRKSIDTRTFTRPKKRSGRLSFESILEAPVSPSSDVWKPQVSPNVTAKIEKEDSEPARNVRESTPPMLKPSNPGVSSLCSSETVMTSGQASLEAFLNMSQSKGIDSFINLDEPEFNDGVMNVSQPSILYSSMMSMTRVDLSETMTQSPPINQTISQPGMEDSQILTQSMMQTSVFGDIAEVDFNDTFPKNSANVTVLENANFGETLDATFVENPESINKVSLKETFNNSPFNAMDATYTPSRLNATLTNNFLPQDPHASYIVSHSDSSRLSSMQHNINNASFVVSGEIASDASFIIKTATPQIANETITRLNIPNGIERNETFDMTQNFDSNFSNSPIASPRKLSLNSTFKTASNMTENKLLKIERNDTFDIGNNFDATYEHSPRKSPANSTLRVSQDSREKSPNVSEQNDTFNVQNFDATYERPKSASPRKSPANSTLRISQDSREKSPNVFEQNDTFNVQNFDATYERPKSASPRKSPINSTFKAPAPMNDRFLNVDNAMNSTYKSQTKIDTTYVDQSSDCKNISPTVSPKKSSINSTFKAPGPLTEKSSLSIDSMYSTYKKNSKMDTTYENHTTDCKNDIPVTNRYNTYKKSSASERMRKENYPTNNLTVKVADDVDTVNRGASLENLDSNFCKQPTKISRPSRLNAPRALSRLPQTLQKSNPNLISSSLKSINTVGRSAIPNFGFNKLARPSTGRHAEGTLSSKLYAIAKVKSGSEQRLEPARNAGDYKIGGTGGSTESIESTQSAHSAPDFDDRLSVCSDSSTTSYSVTSMNIDELQKISRLREESSKMQSTPDAKKRVLENTWIDAAKNLPSPILKQGSETYGSRGSSPRSIDSTVKTSSPLLSPAESLQNLTINVSENKTDNTRENKLTIPQDLGVKKLSDQKSLKTIKNPEENKTGLKPPMMNRPPATTNRPTSGIPRPASRIPAPRLARPAIKSNQGDIKKKGFS